MKKFFKIIGWLLLVLIAFVLIAGLFVSKNYHFEKSITINATREKVWSLVNSLSAMEKWNPWSARDPNLQVTYEGQDGTVGAVYKWKGNKEVGIGEQSISKIEPPSRIETKLHFIEPIDATANAFIQLEDAGTATKTTWGFDSKYPYPMNVMQLFMNMDEMMDKDYSTGLNKLKSLSEAN